jgi:hypothetical protein
MSASPNLAEELLGADSVSIFVENLTAEPATITFSSADPTPAEASKEETELPEDEPAAYSAEIVPPELLGYRTGSVSAEKPRVFPPPPPANETVA